MSQKPTAVDLFCGAGGLSHGFMQAGYEVLFGSDIDATFGKTFMASHPVAKFVAKPIQDLTVDEILAATRLHPGELDVLVGGPPCQGYSVYNHGRGAHDPRAGLFREYLRIVQGLQPKWLVMENVTGLTSISGGLLIDQIVREIKAAGYQDVEYRILKAENYGVPQERRRIVFLANRIGLPVQFPAISHDGEKRAYTTVWDAIGDLPSIFDQREFEDGADYPELAQNDYQRIMRKSSSLIYNHFGPRLSKTNLERIRHIPQGGSWRDVPIDLLPAGMKKAKRSDHTKRYGRPRPTDLACTILTKCDIHWGAYIHPVQNRAFTVREAARLQSFPDDFIFYGSMTEQFVQVGNAVPPLMAKAVAQAILNAEAEAVSIAA
jgi:DNA (cytosine-5)-methyltransferase 1